MNHALYNAWQRSMNFVLDFYSLSFAFVTLISALTITFFSSSDFAEAFLVSQLFINIGVRGVLAFAANWLPLFSGNIAEKYGWEKQNSFQKEIAAADGAFGLLGILSYWIRGDFWTATIIGVSICWLLSEYANISTILKNRNDPVMKIKSNYDVTPELFLGMHIDVVMAVISLIILAVWKGWINYAFTG